MKLFSFGKNKKLLNNRQFKAVLDCQHRASDDLLIVYMGSNSVDHARLGVSVRKSCGNAVVRNRLKRLTREVFRQNQDKIPSGFDYVVMISQKWSTAAGDFADIKKAAKNLKFDRVERSFLGLVEKIAVNLS